MRRAVLMAAAFRQSPSSLGIAASRGRHVPGPKLMYVPLQTGCPPPYSKLQVPHPRPAAAQGSWCLAVRCQSLDSQPPGGAKAPAAPFPASHVAQDSPFSAKGRAGSSSKSQRSAVSRGSSLLGPSPSSPPLPSPSLPLSTHPSSAPAFSLPVLGQQWTAHSRAEFTSVVHQRCAADGSSTLAPATAAEPDAFPAAFSESDSAGELLHGALPPAGPVTEKGQSGPRAPGTGATPDGRATELASGDGPRTESTASSAAPALQDLESAGQGEAAGVEAAEEGSKGELPGRRLPIGAFQHLPAVSPASEIVTSALRRAKLVRPTKGIVNASKRERNKGAKQIDTLTKELSGPLGTYVRGFPRPQRLHPYEQAVLELTLGEGGYEETLGSVDALRKRILDVGKSYASLINKTTSKAEAEEQTEKAFVQLEQLYAKRSHVVDSLKEVAKVLRGMPVVRHDIPTLCLVGAPNVGKSSLVRAISSGKPEVCNYPFTTRGISMGHFFVGTRRHQVTDTPGLLARPDEERNNIELLTIAALSYLPTSVLFVHDLTEECGTSVEDQWRLYCELKQRFGDRPWIDAISKADLIDLPVDNKGALDGEADGTLMSLDEYRQYGPRGALLVSTESGQGLENLKDTVTSVLSDVSSAEDEDMDDAGGEESSSSGSGTDGSGSWASPPPEQKGKKKKKEKDEYYFPAYPPTEEVGR